jgi:hypothetical protein
MFQLARLLPMTTFVSSDASICFKHWVGVALVTYGRTQP